jgi:multidrug efflux system membrane fusion protein
LFPSQFVNVQILADTRRAQIVVPSAAVQQGPQGSFVYVVRDRKAAMRPVTTGMTAGEQTSITQGLQPGEVVVTDGLDRLRDGAAVEVHK